MTSIYKHSKKRILSIRNMKCVTNISRFLIDVADWMIVDIQTVQTDNTREFTNYDIKKREYLFDRILQELGIKHEVIHPFSPCKMEK